MTNSPESLPFPLGHGILHWTTKQGTPLRIRHINADDAPLLVELYGRLSEHTLELRFATMMVNVPMSAVLAYSSRLATLNPENADALVAVVDEPDGERIVAVARLAGATAITAEFAMLVRDDFQGHGVGTFMFDLLLQLALVRGLETLTASVVAENTPMLTLIRRCGFPFNIHTSYGESDVVIYLATAPSTAHAAPHPV